MERTAYVAYSRRADACCGVDGNDATFFRSVAHGTIYLPQNVKKFSAKQ